MFDSNKNCYYNISEKNLLARFFERNISTETALLKPHF